MQLDGLKRRKALVVHAVYARGAEPRCTMVASRWAGKTESKRKGGRSEGLGCDTAVLGTPHNPSLFARYCAVQQGALLFGLTPACCGWIKSRDG